MVRIGVIGGGGREHALAWKLGQEGTEVFAMPGNPGTAQEKNVTNLPINGADKTQFDAVYGAIQKHGIDILLPGPEQPVVDGLVNRLAAKGFFNVFGATQEAAQVEGDKAFLVRLNDDLSNPQAQSIVCMSYEEAAQAIDRIDSEGVVLKYPYLAAGKGVTVCNSKSDATRALSGHAEKYRLPNGEYHVIIAEKLVGPEFSMFFACDGKIAMPFPEAFQDHKHILDGDRGPMTGGMGAYGPAPMITEDDMSKTTNYANKIVEEMERRRNRFHGILYMGMMKTADGPKIIEGNIRLGDPEAQPLLMRLKSSLTDVLTAGVHGGLGDVNIEFEEGSSVCVVMASRGYPTSKEVGIPIDGIDAANAMDGVKVFHAGTIKENERILTAGGRVVGVTSLAPDLESAISRAYRGVELVLFEHSYSRTDIGAKGLGDN